MPKLTPGEFANLYARFHSPITEIDCGSKCAPYNQGGKPFCCDTRHAVPTAYDSEWEYLRNNTNLWRSWRDEDPFVSPRLQEEIPTGQMLIKCLGYTLCQRQFRSITCRAFPFFPYITRQGSFIGLSYYWEYEDRCWVISNLSRVTLKFRSESINAYDWLFEHIPHEKENYRHHSSVMRRVFGRRHRTIPLLHRDGKTYKITPRNGHHCRAAPESLPMFGPFRIASELPFPDELEAPLMVRANK